MRARQLWQLLQPHVPQQPQPDWALSPVWALSFWTASNANAAASPPWTSSVMLSMLFILFLS